MDSSTAIAKVYDDAVALRAQIVERHQRLVLPVVKPPTQWTELELLTPQSKEYDSAWRVQGIQGLTDELRDQAIGERRKTSGSKPVAKAWQSILHDIEGSFSSPKTTLSRESGLEHKTLYLSFEVFVTLA
jgi:hypothetical protein